MSKNVAYYVDNGQVHSKTIDFAHSTKDNISKKKAIQAMNRKLKEIDDRDVKHLDINIRNPNELARALAPYQISLGEYKVESLYHSSKLFEGGGPYQELASMPVGKVLNDPRLKDSGEVIDFYYKGQYWGMDRVFFYDFLFVKAAKESIDNEKLKQLLDYDYFTDIESKRTAERNPARSVAIIKLMLMMFGEIPELNKKDFVAFCKAFVKA